MKRYYGKREQEGCVVWATNPPDPSYMLPARNDVWDHSPSGFEWGYGGSGPAQLALALACDILGDEEVALQVYQDLKWQLIAGLTRDTWTLTEQQVIAACTHPALRPRDGTGGERSDT